MNVASCAASLDRRPVRRGLQQLPQVRSLVVSDDRGRRPAVLPAQRRGRRCGPGSGLRGAGGARADPLRVLVMTPKGLVVAAGRRLLCAAAGDALTAQVRFHYVPVDEQGNTAQQPNAPDGSPGERVRWFGAVPSRSPYRPRPTHLVTFRHYHTGRSITVPVSFPEGTPHVEHRWDRVIYNYGSYTVEVYFLPDGSVDVIYNSGLLRAL